LPETIRLLIANLLINWCLDNTMLTIFRLYSSLFSSAAPTNHCAPLFNQSMTTCFNVSYTLYHNICSLMPF